MSTLTLEPLVVEAAADEQHNGARQNGEQRLRMSYEEYLSAFDDTAHAEWVNGEVIIFMPPGIRHQSLVTFLVTFLNLFVTYHGRGSVLSARLEMRLPNGNAREPDVIFMTHERSGQITSQRIIGPAELVIEIVSPESVARDRGEKFDEYEEAGVKEYWIIDSRPGKRRADFWVLDATGRYRAALPNEEGVYQSTVLKGFWLNVNWLWQEPPMTPLLAFAYISDMQELIRALEVGLA